jgi:hypothetical protein
MEKNTLIVLLIQLLQEISILNINYFDIDNIFSLHKPILRQLLILFSLEEVDSQEGVGCNHVQPRGRLSPAK